MNLKPPLMAILVLGGVQACIGQQVVSSSAGSYANPSASLSWTMGEPITETATNANTTLTQGFEQPSLVVTSVPTTNAKQGSVSAYPNPSTGTVYLQNNDESKTLQVDLVSLEGKTLLTKTVSNQKQEFDLSNYANGIYFLRVYNQDKQLLQTLKVDKTK